MLVRNTAILKTSKKKHLPSLKPQEKKMAPWAQRGPVGPKKALQGPIALSPHFYPLRRVLCNIMVDIHNGVGDDDDIVNFRTYSDAQQT